MVETNAELATLWPAWQIVRAARLEIGSGVLIAGDGGRLRLVLRACGWHGCLWRATCGSSVAEICEHHAPGFEAGVDQVRRALPRPPDAVILLGDAVRHLPAAASLVAKMGRVVLAGEPKETAGAIDLNVYPDIHKRGVTVIGISPASASTGDPSAEWAEASVLIPRLLARRL